MSDVIAQVSKLFYVFFTGGGLQSPSCKNYWAPTIQCRSSKRTRCGAIYSSKKYHFMSVFLYFPQYVHTFVRILGLLIFSNFFIFGSVKRYKYKN